MRAYCISKISSPNFLSKQKTDLKINKFSQLYDTKLAIGKDFEKIGFFQIKISILTTTLSYGKYYSSNISTVENLTIAKIAKVKVTASVTPELYENKKLGHILKNLSMKVIDTRKLYRN